MSRMASSSWSWKAERSVPPFSRVRHTTPSRRITTRSQKEAAKESWVTMKMVASRDSLACSKDRITARLDLESRLPVGSSARISRGRLMRARATAVRCFSPPEISAGYLERMALMPNTSHSWSARASV